MTNTLPESRNKSAMIIGASGLIGSYVLNFLIQDERYARIVLPVRSLQSLHVQSKKVEQHLVDVLAPDTWGNLFGVDEVYCCIGTTIANAGSKEAFIKVDVKVPEIASSLAISAGVKNFSVVSSLGATKKTSNFYLHCKGEMEEKVLAHHFSKTIVVRPSLLLGPRKEKRIGERIFQFISYLISPILIGPLKKYRAIQAQKVAEALIHLNNDYCKGKRIIESDKLQDIASVKRC